MTTPRVALLALLFLACGRNAPSGGQAEKAASVPVVTSSPPSAPREAHALWAEAKDFDPSDLARLADKEGAAGLLEGGRDPALRPVAIRALGHARGLTGIPWLAEVAETGDDVESVAALESAVDIASRPRRAEDPEDALELREGCDRLLALAKNQGRPANRRILAIRALRMLAERGCVRAADLPADLDAR